MTRARFVAFVSAGAALVATTACSGTPDATAPAPTPTAIRQLEPSAMHLVRIDFCDLVPAAAIAVVVGTRAPRHTSWSNGDPVPGASGADVGHEFGCSWTGSGGRSARAWVFARPVSTDFARSLVKDAAAEPGCSAVKDAYGTPSAMQVCPRAGRSARVRHAGLFGDTWLTCELTGRASVSRKNADRWCTAVANALDTNK